MSNYQKHTIVVVTDRTFPRDNDGRPDATKFAEYQINAGLTEAHVLMIADGYPKPGMRDELVIAIAHDLGWEVVFLNTTRSAGNEYLKSFEWWIDRTPLSPAEIVFYGRGLWA